ncbi:ATP-binding protein, partial [Sulfobacillus harzensis]
MAFQFHKATKKQSFLRMALIGPSGSGKTYSSLRIAQGLGKKIAVIDSERGSASKYADEFDFDVLELDTFAPRNYINAIDAAVAEGYDVLIIDSLTHAWIGKGGVLEMHDAAAAQEKSGNSYTAWRTVTPEHNRLVDAMLQAPLHVIATMRSKMEYVQEKNENGKTIIRKVGLQPIQRDGLDFEFDVVGDMDASNTLIVTKTRCRALPRRLGLFSRILADSQDFVTHDVR